jgi:bifunctional non-homologous end joining protein LigD
MRSARGESARVGEGEVLDEYRRKRKFGDTPEPAPRQARPSGNSFVIQKHDATWLHYDLRLEIEGVLPSWAVPKGPSLNPKDKRLAVQTEDHPLEYAQFEGVIPEGNYGAGPVEVWDQGTYELEGKGSAREQLARGEIKFSLHGRKLHGSFALIHTGRRSEDPRQRKNWLLIKHADEHADPGWDIERHDGSVLTGRTLREIEAGLPAPAGSPGELPGARPAPMPAEIEPQLATLILKPFSSPDWVFEVKWDGMRVLAFVSDGQCELRSRRRRSVTSQFPELADLPARLALKEAILDGEAVVLDGQGRPDFERMQQRMNVARPPRALVEAAPVVYYAFDLLYADGHDLREVPLIDRKQFLRRVLRAEAPVRYSEHFDERGEELFRVARDSGLEGIVGKRKSGKYCAGRTAGWVKLKTILEIDAVIGGFTAPRGSRGGFGALLLGLYEGDSLRFIGGAGSGFDQKTQAAVHRQLEPLVTKTMPFRERPETREKATWVEPQLVARVKFAEWTRDRRLRAPVFLGLRPDIDPRDCRLTAETERAESTYAERILEADGDTLTLEVEGRRLKFTHLNKVWFPEAGIRKRDVLAYYARIAEYLLPVLRDRPLVQRRMPDGLKGELFYQKDMTAGLLPFLDTVVIPSEKGKDVRFAMANNLASLLWLTHLGSIDHNPLSSRVGSLDEPDWVFIDLDPTPETPFATVVEVARAVNDVLSEAGLRVFLKTSGASGMHLFVPLAGGYTYQQAAAFGEIVSRLAAARVPELVTFQRIVAKRPKGRVLLDYLQLARGRSLASVYSVRPEPRATVSAPVAAQELRPSLHPGQFTLENMLARIEKAGDLWADFFRSRQRLEPALERLKSTG